MAGSSETVRVVAEDGLFFHTESAGLFQRRRQEAVERISRKRVQEHLPQQGLAGMAAACGCRCKETTSESHGYMRRRRQCVCGTSQSTDCGLWQAMDVAMRWPSAPTAAASSEPAAGCRDTAEEERAMEIGVPLLRHPVSNWTNLAPSTFIFGTRASCKMIERQ